MAFVPVGVQLSSDGFFIGEELRPHAALKLYPHLLLLGAILFVKRLATLRPAQGAHDWHRPRSVYNMDGFIPVSRRNLHGRMAFARGRTADQKWNLQTATVHLGRDVDHFIQRRSNQAAEADDVSPFLDRRFDDLVRRHHHAQINDLVVVATQDHADDVLADVVDIALDRRENQFSSTFHPLRGLLLRFHQRRQVGHRFFHHPGAFYHLGQKHLSFAKKIADNVHPVHERAFNDFERAIIFFQRFFQIRLDVIDDSLNQRMGETLFHALLAPVLFLRRIFLRAFDLFGKLNEALRSVRSAIEEHILHPFQQIGRNLFVHGKLAGVDDAHIHSCLNRVVEKSRVHRLAHRVVAAERKRDVANTSRNVTAREEFLDLSRRFDEVDGVVVVLFDPGRNR